MAGFIRVAVGHDGTGQLTRDGENNGAPKWDGMAMENGIEIAEPNLEHAEA